MTGGSVVGTEPSTYTTEGSIGQKNQRQKPLQSPTRWFCGLKPLSNQPVLSPKRNGFVKSFDLFNASDFYGDLYSMRSKYRAT